MCIRDRDLLIEQSGDNFGPFATPVATVRGNIITSEGTTNVANPNNFALGYFAVVEENTATIIIE